MIDTHSHINDRFGVKDIPKIKTILAASNVEESEYNIKLAKIYKNLFASVGIHPQQTDPENKQSIDEQLNRLDKLIEDNKKFIVAVGECGLDYSPAPVGESDRSKKEQERLFRGQICLSEKYKLPLIVHAREAVDEVIEILSDYKAFGVFHCYTGGKKRIKKILDLKKEWYFGIDGNLTYEEGLGEVVKNIPKDRLVLETDSPFLTPEPFRGKENKPEYVEYVYKKVAEVWQMILSEVEKIIDENAKKLFDLNKF